MYDHTNNNCSNEKFQEQFGSHTRKTVSIFGTKKKYYAWNITHNEESTAV